MLAMSALGALILVGGCKSMDGKDEGVKCPSCGKTARIFHPKKGVTYKKVACLKCGMVTTIDPATGVSKDAHVCETCGTLVADCPKCKGM
jgi:ribosomal protein S27E